MGWSCSMHGEKMDTCGVLVRKPEGKIPLGRPRRRLEDNIVTCRRVRVTNNYE
jgi:hypothetical protein